VQSARISTEPRPGAGSTAVNRAVDVEVLRVSGPPDWPARLTWSRFVPRTSTQVGSFGPPSRVPANKLARLVLSGAARSPAPFGPKAVSGPAPRRPAPRPLRPARWPRAASFLRAAPFPASNPFSLSRHRFICAPPGRWVRTEGGDPPISMASLGAPEACPWVQLGSTGDPVASVSSNREPMGSARPTQAISIAGAPRGGALSAPLAPDPAGSATSLLNRGIRALFGPASPWDSATIAQLRELWVGTDDSAGRPPP